MKVSRIAIRPIWKLERRFFWFGLISATCPRPEDAGAVLLEEEIGLAERRRAGERAGARDLLDPERRVVLLLAGDAGIAQRVAGLPGLAVGLAVRHRRPVGIAVEDRDGIVVIARRGAAWRGVERVED